ncbi:beta-lactamase domain-containing protein [Paramyrothecium foliicola]|nr:beta-lactamase domain-containing protein [Paramyrothecium foliicola]
MVQTKYKEPLSFIQNFSLIQADLQFITSISGTRWRLPNQQQKPSFRQQQAVRDSLPFSNTQDSTDTSNGFKTSLKPNVVTDATCRVIWDNDSYGFLEQEDSPYTANPSLWRQSQLNIADELFEVVPGIYQGVIVIDPLESAETRTAALQLYQSCHGKRPIQAVVYTHSHVDHVGGVKGLVLPDEAGPDKIGIIAPAGFAEHAVSENGYAGIAMLHRATYIYGPLLDRGPQGPNWGSLRRWDATRTFHNLLTLRRAVVQYPHGWSHSLTETIDLCTHESNVCFASHHWPTWSTDNIVKFLTLQRDLYGYVHDQTLRLLNKGYTGPEIAENFTLPRPLESAWSARGYYGSLNHNVKAICQRYLGWFDGNPAHLWEHTPDERAKKYVVLAERIEKIISNGQTAFDNGDFRWTAEILNHAVYAEPDNSTAAGLLADTFDQLGYGAENGSWRYFFLFGTSELRTGSFGTSKGVASTDLLFSLTPEMVFDSLAVQIYGPDAWGLTISMQVILTNEDVEIPLYLTWLSNGVLVYHQINDPSKTDVTITTLDKLPALVIYELKLEDIEEDGIQIDRDRTAIDRLSKLLDPGDSGLNIVMPRSTISWEAHA